MYCGRAMLEYAYDDAAESGLYQKVTKTVVGDAAAPSIVTTQYTDKCGNVVKTGQLLNGTEHLDTFVYDYVGNKTLELSAADAARNLPFSAKYEYNENGQVVKAYNAAGQFTTSTYNALGQLIQTTDYLRARYYDPTIGRFTQQDTHWTTANSIYGDNPQKINEREDKLGLKSYSYAPQITAVMQSGNLYVYGVNNSVYYADSNGNEIAIACAIVLVVLAIGTAVAVFAILQKMIPDAYAASVDLLHEFCVLVKAAENLKECGKRKVADYVACKTDAQVASSDTKDKDEYKHPVSGKSGKEAADDVPSWAKGKRPKKGESGKEFAKRLLDEKYGKGNYTTGHGSEYNKIRKWGDRGFK